MVFFGRSFGKFSLQKKWSLRRQRRELSTTSSQLYPGHGPEITSVSDAIPWWPPLQWLISDLKNIKFNIFRTQLCINTAIVYMQRFYMFHSFSRFHRNSIAAAALFLAAKVRVMILVMTFKQKFNFWFQEGKWWISGWTICSLQVEEQPRKLEHVIKVSHVCLNRSDPHLDSKSEKYLELVSSEKWKKWNIKYFLCFRPKS